MVNFSGVTSKVPLYEIFDFTVEEVSLVLEYMGLASAKDKCQVERMDRFVFLYGDDQEVYNREERDFIKSVGNIYIYREFYKKTKRGTMPCRIIATEIDAMDEVRSAIFFMKEINKAVGGFTIYFIKANEQLFIGMRVFNEDAKDDCMISKPIEVFEDLEDISVELSFVSESDEFIEYYGSLALAIEYTKENYMDYDMQIIKKRGVQYEYPQMLSEIGMIYNVNFSGEISRYYMSLDKVEDCDYISKVKDAISELKFIESFKANTMEMLFEAEEMAQLAAKTEEEHNLFIEEHHDEEIYNEESDLKMKEYLYDPELMIKMLKQRKGI